MNIKEGMIDSSLNWNYGDLFYHRFQDFQFSSKSNFKEKQTSSK